MTAIFWTRLMAFVLCGVIAAVTGNPFLGLLIFIAVRYVTHQEADE